MNFSVLKEYHSNEIKNLVHYKKPFQIDKETLEKITESGLSNKMETSFYFIFKYYNEFFSEKSFYLLNKMNVLQEIYDKLAFFKMKDKKDALKKINKKINEELEVTQEKKTLIVSKLKDIRFKLTKVYLTQDQFRENYVLFKETIKSEMTTAIKSMKTNIQEIRFNLLNLEEKAKKLILLKSKFNSEYLDDENKNKMILFTKYFSNFFDSVAKLKDIII